MTQRLTTTIGQFCCRSETRRRFFRSRTPQFSERSDAQYRGAGSSNLRQHRLHPDPYHTQAVHLQKIAYLAD